MNIIAPNFRFLVPAYRLRFPDSAGHPESPVKDLQQTQHTQHLQRAQHVTEVSFVKAAGGRLSSIDTIYTTYTIDTFARIDDTHTSYTRLFGKERIHPNSNFEKRDSASPSSFSRVAKHSNDNTDNTDNVDNNDNIDNIDNALGGNQVLTASGFPVAEPVPSEPSRQNLLSEANGREACPKCDKANSGEIMF
jgi:hypothetical protein